MPPLLIFRLRAGMNSTLTDLSIDDVRARTRRRFRRSRPAVFPRDRLDESSPGRSTAGDWSSGTVVLADFHKRAGSLRTAPGSLQPGTSVMLSVIFQREPAIAAGRLHHDVCAGRA